MKPLLLYLLLAPAQEPLESVRRDDRPAVRLGGDARPARARLAHPTSPRSPAGLHSSAACTERAMVRSQAEQHRESKWWNQDWKFRRPIVVKNNLDAELKAGHPVRIDIDVDFLGLREKSKKDLSDLAVVHRG